ncbi:MAG TPA: TrbI/VirB10 family protein [Acidobacteriaceae bacterium]|nr:TrbI/VirB10 family protein [Acidobacteriaceae bacterium]
MPEQIVPELPAEPELKKKVFEPRGVLQKNMKMLVFLGASALVIVAAIISAGGKKPASQAATKNQPPQPMIQDNTDSNIQDLKSQLAAEQQKDAQQQAALAQANAVNPLLAGATPAQQTAAAGYAPNGLPVACVPGQPCAANGALQQQASVPQLTPAQQQAQQLAAKEQALAYDSRFASNLVYTHVASAPPSPDAHSNASGPNAYAQAAASQPESSLIAPRAAGEPSASQPKRNPEVNIDAAVGQPYVIYEGTTLDTVLMNRLDGDAPGPVKVLVSMPLYSHDGQHVLIPDGTIVLGEARKIGAAGFGQQRRMAVTFHRMIMPDGYSVDLDQFHGLDQIGEEGLKDKVNNHYLQIFGTSIALGVIAGAGEIEEGGGTITTSGSQAFATGASASISQSATTVLDRFLQIPPTITIREGHRVKVYFTQDMLLPAYSNHTISPTF